MSLAFQRNIVINNEESARAFLDLMVDLQLGLHTEIAPLFGCEVWDDEDDWGVSSYAPMIGRWYVHFDNDADMRARTTIRTVISLESYCAPIWEIDKGFREAQEYIVANAHHLDNFQRTGKVSAEFDSTKFAAACAARDIALGQQ